MRSTSTSNDPRGFKCKIGDFGLSHVLEHGSDYIHTHTHGAILDPTDSHNVLRRRSSHIQ